MEDISEYDKRQLKLMQESIVSFDENLIELTSLVSTFEFLLGNLELNRAPFAEKIAEEIDDLEMINALDLCKEAGEDVPTIEKNEKQIIIKKAIDNLKNIIKNKLR